jgi:GNAT superfamily N-acetyltransferase
VIEMRPSKAEEVPAQKALWKRAFGDGDSYIDDFYTCCAQPENMLVLLEDGVLRSMLALLPMTIALPDGTRATSSYIYALATDPEFRKHGFGRMLLQYVDFYLGERGVDCVTTVPAEASLHKFFGTVGFTECFATRKIELTAAEAGTPGPGDAVAPASPEEYSSLRENLLEGTLHAEYCRRLLAYQEHICRASGGALLRLEVGGNAGCAAVELEEEGRAVVIKELLIPHDKIPAALAAVAAAYPADRYHLRTPAFWPGHRTSYIQPFAMVKWLSGQDRRAWSEETGAYFGLAFD